MGSPFSRGSRSTGIQGQRGPAPAHRQYTHNTEHALAGPSRGAEPNFQEEEVRLVDIACRPMDSWCAYTGPGVDLFRYFSYTDWRTLGQRSMGGKRHGSRGGSGGEPGANC